MTLVWWMAGASGASCLAAIALLGTAIGPEVALGMAGPLVVASVTWVLTERTYKRNPEQLTPLMVKAFAGKIVFFGAYVAVLLTALSLRPVPFVISFTSYFIALHLMEALRMRQLFSDLPG